jgi:hypothetical protein
VHLTGGLNVKNTVYSSIMGADFEPVQLKRGWTLFPMAYLGYNGASQSYGDSGSTSSHFGGVKMSQNGGQAGAMATFARGDFRASILGYGGGLRNIMYLEGHKETTNHWMAGGAVKTAYNLRPTESRRLVIQPNAMFTYNIFSGYDHNSSYGDLYHKLDNLHSIGVAPGVNMIYERDAWSAYTTLSYLINVQDQATGRVDQLGLPDIKMRHGGYFEYGIGLTKKFRESLNSFVQATFRHGGRDGIALSMGLNIAVGRDYKKDRL